MSKTKNNKKARSPPWKKKTPTNYPGLQQIWENMYRELINEFPKSRALEIIGDHYGVTRQTVMFHLSPQYRKKQKDFHSKRWSNEKQDPVIRKKITDYKSKYKSNRRHIDQLIINSFQRTAPKVTMTLEDLAYAIHDISSIFFKPETILGLVKRFEHSKGYPLLIDVPKLDDGVHYALSKDLGQY